VNIAFADLDFLGSRASVDLHPKPNTVGALTHVIA
jgi:hypothetical protein